MNKGQNTKSKERPVSIGSMAGKLAGKEISEKWVTQSDEIFESTNA